MIYDEEADKLQHITFAEALYAANVGTGKIDPKAAFGITNARLEDDGPENALMERSIAKIPAADRPEAANAFLNVKAMKDENGDNDWVNKLAKTVALGIWVPVCITIARPFIEHLMMSAIMTVSGRDTGATLFGPADMRERHDHESTHMPVHPSPY